MRILFCNYEYPPLGGGGGVINALLARTLATDHEVTVLTSRGGDKPAREVVDGVEVLRVPVLSRHDASAASLVSMACYLPMGWYEGRRAVQRKKYDIINTHFVVPTGPVGQSLAKFAGIPNVLSVHGGDLFDPSKAMSPHRHAVLRTIIRRLLNSADCVVGQSANTIDNVHKYYLPDLPCENIPLGIQRPAKRNIGREELGFGADDLLLSTVGRLVGRKANDQLIHMVSQLGDERVRLIFIGDGPCRPTLEQLAAELGVSEQIYFAGFTPEAEKEALLQVSDLYVSTSQHEGFGLVYLEAMAAGLPVICYDFGGHTDFLEQGQTGAVVKLNALEEFTASCKALLGSKESRVAAAAENLSRVEGYFIDTCAARYAELFEATIAGFKTGN
jgi:glycosyltransferase involved in cell wall biosynthesis